MAAERVKTIVVNGRKADVWKGDNGFGGKAYKVTTRQNGQMVEPSYFGSGATLSIKSAVDSYKLNMGVK